MNVCPIMLVQVGHQASCRSCTLGFTVLALVFVALSDLVTARLLGFGVDDDEAQLFAEKLRLHPGMTICEVGVGSGDLMARLSKRVMPGGRFVATSISSVDLWMVGQAVRAAAGKEAQAALTTYLATDSDWAPGLPNGSCDAVYSRM